MGNQVLRLKMVVNSVKKVADGEGDIVSEELNFAAVYGKEGTTNAQWSKWTPFAQLSMTINNTEAFNKIFPGQFVFVDLTICEKEGM